MQGKDKVIFGLNNEKILQLYRKGELKVDCMKMIMSLDSVSLFGRSRD
jgi:hypothetical protein